MGLHRAAEGLFGRNRGDRLADIIARPPAESVLG
jgi:hypothetical protein